MGEDSGTTIAVRVARMVVERIQVGEYPVGSVLPSEAELARQSGISRASVREALSALQFAGYVGSRRGFGSVVLSDRALPGAARDTRAASSWAEVADLLEARLVLEPATVALAATDPDPEALDAAHRLLRGMEVAVAGSALADDTDHRLHAALASVCRNSVLSTQVHVLLARASGPRWREGQRSAWQDDSVLRRWCADHAAVIDAIASGDARAAAAACRHHLMSAVHHVLLVDDLPPSVRKRLRALTTAHPDAR